MEKIIETLRETVNKQQIRIKKMEKDTYKLEHKCLSESVYHEEVVNSMQKELLSVQQVNNDLQVFEKKFKQATDEITELNRIIDRNANKNYHMKQTISHQFEKIRFLKLNLHNLENNNKLIKRLKDELEVENRNNIREMKKSHELHTMLNRRFHQLSKKYSELTEHELTMK